MHICFVLEITFFFKAIQKMYVLTYAMIILFAKLLPMVFQ